MNQVKGVKLTLKKKYKNIANNYNYRRENFISMAFSTTKYNNAHITFDIP